MVERIINKISNENIDIDKLLVVTFTNAAATEMRERILDAIYKKLEKNPEDARLQKQILLLNKANISTIHSFCLDVIKNNFYKTDISPNFRLASTPEIELLKMETIENVFEELYEEKNEEFIKLTNAYAGYRGDDELKEIILSIYKFIQSTPFPKEWLEEQIEKFNMQDKIEQDFAKTEWGKILVNELKDKLVLAINKLKSVSKKMEYEAELSKFYLCLLDDITNFEEILCLDYWDEILDTLNNLKLKTWPRDTKIASETKDKAKEIRDEIKKDIKTYKEKMFIYNSEQANKDIFSMYELLVEIKNVVFKFMNEYQELKKEKNIIDFNDIEHYALNLLVEKDQNGKYVPTDVARIYQEKFEEIAIDEYQDSNLVQEYILSMVSRGNNIFMVGDVKQSIYKFRQARPELFLEKYKNYSENIEIKTNGRKIKLFENFRSRKNVLDITNLVFKNIMSTELGDIDYNKEEYLNQGLEYEKPKENIKTLNKAEIHIIDMQKDEEEDNNNDDDDVEILDNIEIEAKFVAKKIKEIIDSNTYVWDKKKGYRLATFKDFAILLRSTATSAPIYERELANLGFPAFCDTSTNYFESNEIQVIMNILKIVDNPKTDIPLVSVLRSPIIGITDNELVEIRTINKQASFYDALCQLKEEGENKTLIKKINNFFILLEDLQKKQEYLKLDELIWYIYEKTGYYNYVSVMTDGEIKTANLKMLFEKAKDYEEGSFKGLYNFINFIDRTSKAGSDMGSPKLIGENENVIRIMSIHKSKGLEFPIVFLSGTGKWFNMQDLNQNILMHQDIGIGPKYINYERKIEYSTLAKEALRIRLKTEQLAEEMRLLYVALTRAREKLIITGIDKNLKKSLKNKEELLESNCGENKIDKNITLKAKNYLDWLEMVFIYDNKKDELIDIFEYKAQELEKRVEDINQKKFKPEIIKDNKYNVEEILNWQYPYIKLTTIEGKSSVSKLAKKEEIKYQVEPIKLNSIGETQKLGKADIGTITHLILQKLNINENYTLEKVNKLLEILEAKKIITASEKEAVNIKNIFKYTQGKIFKDLKHAKKVYREKPFYINIPTKEIYENNTSENILVQGIVDLCYINENNDIILVDYKTDYVPEKNEEYLVEKYKAQLELYRKAIEQALNRNVKEIYIYSTYLNKEIKLV